MPDLEINGIHMPIRPEIHNWEQLLNELETKHLSTGHVISSVTFDGDEVIQFRDVELLRRPLHSIGGVKVEAVRMEQMVKEAIKDSEGYLITLQTSLADIADSFRSQLLEQANTKLSQVYEGIKMLVALLQGIELSISGQYQTGSTEVELALEEMGPTLESLIEAQSQKDWILVADILEFELLTNLATLERTILGYKQKLGIY